MAIAEPFRLHGLDGVLDRLRTLPVKLQKRALRTAMRKAGNVVKSAAIANAKAFDDPDTAERIWRNITVQFRSRASKSERGIVMAVGVRGGAREYGNTKENVRKQRVGSTYKTLGSAANPGGDTWYWRFIELGTSKQRARPFLRPALESNVEAATNVIVNELNAELDRLVRTNAPE